MKSARAQRLLKAMRKICLAWPETSEDVQFGSPVWKAGKKSFALAYFRGDALKAGFWTGVDRQGLLTAADERFSIPMYMGHNGWIELDAGKAVNEAELRNLAHDSYRHFANKRMLKQLGHSRTKRKS